MFLLAISVGAKFLKNPNLVAVGGIAGFFVGYPSAEVDVFFKKTPTICLLVAAMLARCSFEEHYIS